MRVVRRGSAFLLFLVMAVDWNRVGGEWDKWVGHVKAKLAAESGGESSKLYLIVGGVVVVAAVVVLALRRMTAPQA